MDSTTNKRKETNINGELSSRTLLPLRARPSAPVPSIMYENWAGVDIMYYLDGRWRCQSLVYLASRVCPRMSRRCLPGGARYVPAAIEIFGRGDRLDVF